VTARGAGPLAVADAPRDPRVAHLPPVTSGRVGAYLGVPLTSNRQIVGSLCVYHPTRRAWTPLAAEHDTVQVRLGLAVAAAGIGSFDWNLRTGALHCDQRLLQIYGYDDHPVALTFETPNARVHPDDLPGVTRGLSAAATGVGEYDQEYRVAAPDRSTRWVAA